MRQAPVQYCAPARLGTKGLPFRGQSGFLQVIRTPCNDKGYRYRTQGPVGSGSPCEELRLRPAPVPFSLGEAVGSCNALENSLA